MRKRRVGRFFSAPVQGGPEVVRVVLKSSSKEFDRAEREFLIFSFVERDTCHMNIKRLTPELFWAVSGEPISQIGARLHKRSCSPLSLYAGKMTESMM